MTTTITPTAMPITQRSLLDDELPGLLLLFAGVRVRFLGFVAMFCLPMLFSGSTDFKRENILYFLN